MVAGSPLCHVSEGQKLLTDDDYSSLGSLFLLVIKIYYTIPYARIRFSFNDSQLLFYYRAQDLVIRNTDRLPSRLAVPRPGSSLVRDQGNPGNVMLGAGGGAWNIDPGMIFNI